MNVVDNVVNSMIGRVAVVVVSVSAPVVAVFVAWLQAKIGVHLDPTQVSTLIGTTVAGVVALGYKWLHNRGEYEKAVVLGTAVVKEVEDAGRVYYPPNPGKPNMPLKRTGE